MHRTTATGVRPGKNIAAQKFALSLVLFSTAGLLLVAPWVRLDLSLLVLVIAGVGWLFMSLRTVNALRLSRRVKAAVTRYASPGAQIPPYAWRHVIVVPIYKESMETIEATIGALAQHRAAASGYVVLCAHEQADGAHDEKFRRLQAAFAGRFIDLVKSVHAVAPYECPGKAANVNHAVRSYAARQPADAFDRTMITVIDTDTLIDERYFQELERVASSSADPHCVVFAAPTFFESNRREVPAFVRAMDDLWSFSAATNIFSNSRLGFPISNYSLSLRMLDEMDYWDVDYDSVGEDFHTVVKATVKLKKNVRLLPIAIPLNNENVMGHTYAGSLVARYSQSMRHALGISSTAYLLQHLLTSPFSPRKSLLFLLCLECHTLPLLYFASGAYVAESALLGDFHVYFHGGKLLLLGLLSVASAVLFNLSFTLYKSLQFYVRDRVFAKPRNIVGDIASDLCDLAVQAWCTVGYFIVPFGFRAYQNLMFRTNTTYYNRLEETARKY